MEREKADELIKETDSMFTVLQRLDIKPTVNNMQILTGCLESLRFIYDALKEEAEDGTTDPE